MRFRPLSPFLLPVIYFCAVIVFGGLALFFDSRLEGGALSWLDALFTATSATCVTGLVVKDTGAFFTEFSQGVILVLIQLGGLGIMVYTNLAMYLLRRRITLTNRVVVAQALLQDQTFNLGRFLLQVVVGTLALELVGAGLLFCLDPRGFNPFSALFHSISAFCNAGFSLQSQSLTPWRSNLGVNLVFMALIVLGGLGFSVLNECWAFFKSLLGFRGSAGAAQAPALSWQAGIVLKTTLFLLVAGTVFIFAAEFIGGEKFGNWEQELLASAFQSVTCRTAGFNTVSIAHLTNLSLVIMVALMFIGGSSGSCAGGIKTTAFRACWGFIVAKLKGREQIMVGRQALGAQAVNNALTLIIFAGFTIAAAVLVLSITEGGDVPHPRARGLFLEILFEAVSAFGTVGLSTGLTYRLTPIGKIVIITLMFVGRIGPIWLLSALQVWQKKVHYRLPERELPMG